MGGYHSP